MSEELARAREPRYVPARDGRIVAYQQLGSGKIAVLAIHGFAASRRSWIDLFQRLVSDGVTGNQYRFLAVDLPGFGASSKPRSGYDYTSQSDTLADFLKQVDGENGAVIMGNSMGGGIALRLALDYPYFVRGLILIGTGAGPARGRSTASGRAAAGLEVARNPSFLHPYIRGWFWKPDKNLVDGLVKEALQMTETSFHASLAAIRNNDFRPELARLPTVPALILHGSHDASRSRAEAEELAATLPESCTITVDGAGHVPHIERPDFVAAHIRSWLRACSISEDMHRLGNVRLPRGG
jgi:pimeloyl-ACP methyl ester carboxylesterase